MITYLPTVAIDIRIMDASKSIWNCRKNEKPTAYDFHHISKAFLFKLHSLGVIGGTVM